MNFSAKPVYTIAAAALLALPSPLPGGQARAQVGVPAVNDTLGGRLPPLEGRLEKRVGDTVDDNVKTGRDAVGDRLDEYALDGTVDAGGEAVESLAGEATNTVRQAGAAVAGVARTVQGAVAVRPFVSDIDPFGRTIEKNVLVVLVDDADLKTVAGYGLDVIARREMAGLGMTLVTLRGPNAHTLAETAVDLRQAVPGAAVDYNHIYRETASVDGDEAADADRADTSGDARSKDVLRIGMIDSAVVPGHRALADSTVIAKDFVTHDGSRPTGHGTAVASLLAGATSQQAAIYSASVFFQAPGYAPGATTESLVAALDWLAAEQVDAINMSLAGPANALLARALENMDADGPAVIAAVGNNGPSGAPQYPAAYEQVIGVTAVDRERRIFRYANRGSHVAFAALGVDVKVADAAGGWRIESGTSMASPVVAAVVASTRKQGHANRQALLATLISVAEDLGRQGFDDIFGHGLLTEPPTIAGNLRTRPQN